MAEEARPERPCAAGFRRTIAVLATVYQQYPVRRSEGKYPVAQLNQDYVPLRTLAEFGQYARGMTLFVRRKQPLPSRQPLRAVLMNLKFFV